MFTADGYGHSFVTNTFSPDYVDYQRAWDVQRDLHAKVVAGDEPDTATAVAI